MQLHPEHVPAEALKRPTLSPGLVHAPMVHFDGGHFPAALIERGVRRQETTDAFDLAPTYK